MHYRDIAEIGAVELVEFTRDLEVEGELTV